MLSIEEEAVNVAFRLLMLLPLDDCPYAPQATIPHLTRLSLHRRLQRHRISRLPSRPRELWRFKYRSAGEEKLLAFGVYPAVSLAAARLHRAEAKVGLGQGRDPGAKDAPSSVITPQAGGAGVA